MKHSSVLFLHYCNQKDFCGALCEMQPALTQLGFCLSRLHMLHN